MLTIPASLASALIHGVPFEWLPSVPSAYRQYALHAAAILAPIYAPRTRAERRKHYRPRTARRAADTVEV